MLLDNGTSVTLPTGWKELHVAAWVSQYSVITFHILPGDIVASPSYIGSSRVTLSETLLATLVLTANNISLEAYEVNNSNNPNGRIRVYYR